MTLRTAADLHDQILEERLDTLVPMLMERAGLDAWVLTAREYNEDPVLQTMLPASWRSTSRRRTILLFTHGGTRRVAVARYAVGDAFEGVWDGGDDSSQMARLAELLEDADPRNIGINRSSVFPLADGISSTEYDTLRTHLPAALSGRLTSAEAAAIGWLETRLPSERPLLERACAAAHGMLRTALSGDVIHPGSTTTADVEWWLVDKAAAAGHETWFHPTCSAQRRGGLHRTSFASKPDRVVIEPGDLVHIDFGIVAGGYCTDQQQHAYVGSESDTIAELSAGLSTANRLQDLLITQFVAGRTGNEILTATRARAMEEGIDGLIYTHPIGIHGHAAGPTIGLWDQQDAVPGQGDYPLHPDTAYSIELQARTTIDSWDGQVVQFMLEEDAFFDGTGVVFLDGRQTTLWIVQ
ncbi:MAG: aminopeptidase P family protein [Acidimicrobiia bacterium]|nr:aminopeptidase P family protein [Acidimicrobiia bacterium]MDH4306574.1 aminopeptidase P family protein [Acidimicrobiia bacterium]MDH5294276.1 aminopeptidase P family protein [Acidimicrobiia bacterium]